MIAFAWGSAPVPIILLIIFAGGAVLAVPVIMSLIDWQRRRALGQQIYQDGPSSHAVKQGTPTMGGLAFVAVAVLAVLLFANLLSPDVPLLLLVLVAAAIGFTDDYLKLSRQRALGLRARAKFGLLLLAACGFVAWEIYRAGNLPPEYLGSQIWFGGEPIPGLRAYVALPTWLWAALAVTAIVGAANAVNLTDGLDGLAAGTTLPPLLLLTYIVVSAVGAAVAGACTSFLFFNRHPARIFMGDTGSLALGALLGGLAAEYHALLILPLIGIVFVAEALSVILQVIWFKATGRRIFKMSPLHHHFEMSGWSETKVTTTFVVASWVATLAVYVGLLPANPWLWPFARGSAL
jgi:phospho-N-acetylmuramoyl-pentapeptide-transferase